MSLTDCIVCGGRRYLDQRGMPTCEPCGPMFAAHEVSMRTAPGEWLAVCPCGWVSRHPRSEAGQLDREAAVVAHWRAASQFAVRLAYARRTAL